MDSFENENTAKCVLIMLRDLPLPSKKRQKRNPRVGKLGFSVQLSLNILIMTFFGDPP